jgi:Tol biopolymer transport system component
MTIYNGFLAMIDRSKLETRSSPDFTWLLAILLLITLTAFAQEPVAAPQSIADPTQLQSKTVADMQNFSIEKLYMTRQIGDSTWSPDGKQIAFISNISGRSNLWLVPAGGGWPTQLTISDQRQAQPVWSPDGTWIAYISDHDGDEQWDIFLVSPKTGDVVNLTISPDSAEVEPAWSPDGHQIAYATKPKTGSSYEIDLMDVTTRHLRHLTKNTPKELGNENPIFSRDGKFLVYTQSHAAGKDANVFLCDVASGRSTNLTPHEGQHNFLAADISPDSKSVLITSDAHNGYDNVGLVDIASKKIDWLTSDK